MMSTMAVMASPFVCVWSGCRSARHVTPLGARFSRLRGDRRPSERGCPAGCAELAPRNGLARPVDGNMTAPQPHDEASYRRGERRWLMLACCWASSLFVIVVLCLPDVGPVLRVYAIPVRVDGAGAAARQLRRRLARRPTATAATPSTTSSCRSPAACRHARAASGATSSCSGCRATTDTQFLKRVVGLPGDRIQMVEGRLSINGELVPPRAGGQDPPIPSATPARSPTYVETLPGGRSLPHRPGCEGDAWPLRQYPAVSRCPRAISSFSATTVTTPPTAACSRRASASASCPSSL